MQSGLTRNQGLDFYSQKKDNAHKKKPFVCIADCFMGRTDVRGARDFHGWNICGIRDLSPAPTREKNGIYWPMTLIILPA
jgi:hypothetical protein